MFAAWHAGLVVVPVNARLHRDEIAFILEDSGTSAVVTDPEHVEDIDAPAIIVTGTQWDRLVAADPAPLMDRQPDDPAWLFYTSGTTGRPKGATLTNRNLLMMSLSYYADIDSISPRDSVLHAAPLSHGSGLYGLPHIARGAVSVIGDDSRSRGAGRGCRCSPPRPWSSDSMPTRAPSEDDHLRRRADVPGRPRAGAAGVRAAAGPDLRAGRDADDHHRPVEAGPRRRRSRSSAERRHRRAPTSRSARRVDGEILVPRRRRDGGLLEPARGHGGDARRTAGCTPGTSAASTSTATSRCTTAPRT